MVMMTTTEGGIACGRIEGGPPRGSSKGLGGTDCGRNGGNCGEDTVSVDRPTGIADDGPADAKTRYRIRQIAARKLLSAAACWKDVNFLTCSSFKLLKICVAVCSSQSASVSTAPCTGVPGRLASPTSAVGLVAHFTCATSGIVMLGQVCRLSLTLQSHDRCTINSTVGDA
eukprot:6191477-Pleurochrysis_carterae.AAC.1